MPTVTGASVAVGLADGLVRFAASRGVEQASLLEAAGLTREDLDDPDGRIGLAAYRALMRAAKAESADPALALRWGASVDMAEISILGLIMNASRTMGEAFAQLQRFSRIALEIQTASTQPHFILEHDAAGLWMIDTWTELADFPEIIEAAFARLVCGPRRFLRDPHVLEVRFAHADPGYRDVYDAVFQCPIAFDQPRNAMRLAPNIAERPVALEPAYLLPVLSRHAEDLLAGLSGDETTAGRVERVLIETLPQGRVTAAEVASALGMSSRSLHRRLRRDGTRFSVILDGLRRRLAHDLLKRPGASVKNAAYLLGFSDPAAFSRAFKRWSGESPKAFIDAGRAGRPHRPL